mmetsp:Transcript_41766/g.100237  ORF Transcript_41766/g.100237 Transcript_41766/m.100237 type:complete len:213 (+) Transcript_41766:373-1011(+)
MTGIDNGADIFVTLRRFLHDQLRGGNSHRDALGCQIADHVVVIQGVARLVATQRPPRAVARAAKRIAHPLLGPCQHIRACAHRSANQHWLPRHLVVHRNQWVVGGEGSCGPLPMHEQLLHLPIHQVLLHLCNVVRHVVDQVHVQVLRRLVKDLGECLPGQEGHGGSIDPRVVGRGSHTSQVILPLSRLNSCTGQLPVVCLNFVAIHCSLHLH